MITGPSADNGLIPMFFKVQYFDSLLACHIDAFNVFAFCSRLVIETSRMLCPCVHWIVIPFCHAKRSNWLKFVRLTLAVESAQVQDFNEYDKRDFRRHAVVRDAQHLSTYLTSNRRARVQPYFES